MFVNKTQFFDSYEMHIEDMQCADLEKLHELSVSVNWPHRANDWLFLQGLGHGFVLKDEIDRLLGSVMWFPMGEELIFLGMLITSPRLQKMGAATWLMREIRARNAEKSCFLMATNDAYPLYLSFDFEAHKRVYQICGIVDSHLEETANVRTAEKSDYDAIVALDRLSFGAPRDAIIKKLLSVSKTIVLERQGELVGYAMRRKYGMGHMIGPVVAENEENAIELINPHLKALDGQYARIDTSVGKDGKFLQYLHKNGMTIVDKVTMMYQGEKPKEGPVQIFGLGNQSFG